VRPARLAAMTLGLAAGLAALGAPARAQEGVVGVTSYWVRNHVAREVPPLGYGRDILDGTMLGVAGRFSYGRWSLVAEYAAGKLGGTTYAGTAGNVRTERAVRDTELGARVRLFGWLALGYEAHARHLALSVSDTTAGAATWRLSGPSATLLATLGRPDLRAEVGYTHFVSRRTAGSAAITGALRTVVQMTWRSARRPIQISLAYCFERLDHGTEGEDFQGGRMSVSYLLGGLHR
jgi:hypothetical protein